MLCWRDAVSCGEDLCGFAEVVAGLEGFDVDLGDLWVALLLGEFLIEVVFGCFEWSLVEPVNDAEGEHVSAAVDVLGAHS